VGWGGSLPTTADCVAHYLADHAESLSINTLSHRLTALAQWHSEQGSPDPTKALIVRNVLRGIRALHPAQEKQAKPLQLCQLEQVIRWLDVAIETAQKAAQRPMELCHRRDEALILLGFWRGFRCDELTRLRIEHVQGVAGQGMTCYLAQTKTNRTY
jgi:hypothetical protein